MQANIIASVAPLVGVGTIIAFFFAGFARLFFSRFLAWISLRRFFLRGINPLSPT